MASTLAARRLGLAALVGGLLLVALAQRLAPVGGPPLYDGVIVADPYRYVNPPPGQKGDPPSASATEQLQNGASPVTAVATGEQPPQAQIFAAPGALVLPAGTTAISVSIAPIRAKQLPTDGRIAGNAYRFTLVTQAGAPIISSVGAKTTVVLRGPAGLADAKIEWFTAGAWQQLPTQPAGLPATFLTTVTDFGDFALVVLGPAATAAASAASGSASASGEQAMPSPPTPAQTPGAPAGGSGGLDSRTIVAAVAAALLLGLLVLRVLADRLPSRRGGGSDR